MKKNKQIYISGLLVLVILFVPYLAGAAGFVPCSGTNCSACHFVTMANSIIKWLVALLFMVFAFVMAIAGFGLVSSKGNEEGVEQAKSKFAAGLIGIIIVLAAWLLIDVLIRALVGGSGEIDGRLWTTIECHVQETSSIVREATIPNYSYDTESDNSSGDAGSSIPPASDPSEGGYGSHSEAVAALNPGGFTVVSSGNCTDRSRSTCTSLDGVRPTTISRINELQSAVGAPLTITGGTETGHANMTYSHSNGYKIDLKPSPALNDYIYSNFTKIGPTKYKDSNGNTYYRHPPDHWDVTITN